MIIEAGSSLLRDLKTEDAIPVLVDAIENPEYQPITTLLVAACWQNGLAYGKYAETFEDLEEEAKTINGHTIEVIQGKSKLMVSHIDSLFKKIPDTLNSPVIYSRLIVVKTRTQILNQEVNKAHLDSVRLQEYFNEMNISVKNLFTQINEKFEKDAIDLQRIDSENKELEQQKQFLDSVYKEELKDQKKN